VKRFALFLVCFWASVLLGIWAARQRPAPIEPEDDYMCPNCVTPWKCNGPHIPDVQYHELPWHDEQLERLLDDVHSGETSIPE
jgi:hypothetical protein